MTHECNMGNIREISNDKNSEIIQIPIISLCDNWSNFYHLSKFPQVINTTNSIFKTSSYTINFLLYFCYI